MLSETKGKREGFLSGNQLKILAALFMIVDHVGALFFPGIIGPMSWMRYVGRLSFPIFAFFIAEGCRYTKNRARYLGVLSLMGLVFHLVYYYVVGDETLNVIVTFAMGVALVYAWQNALFFCREKRVFGAVLGFVLFFGYGFLCYKICKAVHVDYRFGGIILPWLVYLTNKKWMRLFFFALGIVVVAIGMGEESAVEVWALLSVPIMALYSGERGKMRMKYFFYLFYPIHLVALYGIYLLYMGVL